MQVILDTAVIVVHGLQRSPENALLHPARHCQPLRRRVARPPWPNRHTTAPMR
jgi:hypothetical protein